MMTRRRRRILDLVSSHVDRSLTYSDSNAGENEHDMEEEDSAKEDTPPTKKQKVDKDGSSDYYYGPSWKSHKGLRHYIDPSIPEEVLKFAEQDKKQYFLRKKNADETAEPKSPPERSVLTEKQLKMKLQVRDTSEFHSFRNWDFHDM